MDIDNWFLRAYWMDPDPHRLVQAKNQGAGNSVLVSFCHWSIYYSYGPPGIYRFLSVDNYVYLIGCAVVVIRKLQSKNYVITQLSQVLPQPPGDHTREAIRSFESEII